MDNYETMLYCDALAERAEKALDELTEHVNENDLDYLVYDAELYTRDVVNMAEDETHHYYDRDEVNEKHTKQIYNDFIKYLQSAIFSTVQCAQTTTKYIDYCNTVHREKRLASTYAYGIRILKELHPIVNALNALDEKAALQESETLERLETALESIREHAPFSDLPTMEMWEQSHKNRYLPGYFWKKFIARAKGTEREKTGEKLLQEYGIYTCAIMHVSGFCYNGAVYACYTRKPIITTVKPSSRGFGMALRFVPSKADKAYMVENGTCIIICAASELEEERRVDENKGEAFERLLRKHLHLDTLEKDNTAFFEGVDIKNYALSVKFEGATIIHEKHLESI